MADVVRNNGLRRPNHSLTAFLYSIPIAVLGGLIGLGGAEFRLPVLAGPLGYSAKRAVPLNLAVSLITIAASFAIRGKTLTLAPIQPYIPAIVAMICGGVTTAFIGTALFGKLSNEQLEKVILILLVIIGCALFIEGLLPQSVPALVPAVMIWRVLVGLVAGLAIGMVSSMLGVAGGELIIPTLVFAFGVDIKTAGTASLLISLPTVLVGVIRYARRGAFEERTVLTSTVAPMGIGSIIGAVAGGLLVGVVPPSVLKLGLGVILIVSAVRIFRHHKR